MIFLDVFSSTQIRALQNKWILEDIVRNIAWYALKSTGPNYVKLNCIKKIKKLNLWSKIFIIIKNYDFLERIIITRSLENLIRSEKQPGSLGVIIQIVTGLWKPISLSVDPSIYCRIEVRGVLKILDLNTVKWHGPYIRSKICTFKTNTDTNFGNRYPQQNITNQELEVFEKFQAHNY